MHTPVLPLKLKFERLPYTKTTIEPAFSNCNLESITRVIIKVTHFNNQKVNGYILNEDTEHQVYEAIRLELSYLHGDLKKIPREIVNSERTS
jgi:hypothetical protein